jgi:hypothetical protein
VPKTIFPRARLDGTCSEPTDPGRGPAGGSHPFPVRTLNQIARLDTASGEFKLVRARPLERKDGSLTPTN